jgi:hypothetical protein
VRPIAKFRNHDCTEYNWRAKQFLVEAVRSAYCAYLFVVYCALVASYVILVPLRKISFLRRKTLFPVPSSIILIAQSNICRLQYIYNSVAFNKSAFCWEPVYVSGPCKLWSYDFFSKDTLFLWNLDTLQDDMVTCYVTLIAFSNTYVLLFALHC